MPGGGNRGGLRRDELVPGRRARDAAVREQAGQDRAEGAGADPAEAAQGAAGERGGRLGQGLLDALAGRRGRRREDARAVGRVVDDVQGEGLALGAELDDEAVAGGGGAVLDGQAERVAAPTQIKVGVAPMPRSA